MAWNGSGQNTSSPGSATSTKSPYPAQGTRHKAQGTKHGLLALLLLLALAGAAVWYFCFRPAPPPAPKAQGTKHKAQIAAVAPTIVTNRVAHRASAADADKGKSVGDHASSSSTPTPVAHDDPPVAKARYDVFKHRSESRLAQMVCAPYGTRFIGGAPFDEVFMEDLRAALKDDIEISPDDPEDIRQYKESVIEVKKHLKEMFDRGENVQAELTKTWDELQKIGVYKQELETEMRKIQHQNCKMSNAELSDLVGAVNSMLADKGIEPLEFNKLTGVVVSRKPFPEPEDLEMEERELNEGKDEELNQEENQ